MVREAERNASLVHVCDCEYAGAVTYAHCTPTSKCTEKQSYNVFMISNASHTCFALFNLTTILIKY